ncbi:hypothetical protein ACLBSQ_19165 [Klebsiella pneumoniae]
MVRQRGTKFHAGRHL